jgi:hypothetical protein
MVVTVNKFLIRFRKHIEHGWPKTGVLSVVCGFSSKSRSSEWLQKESDELLAAMENMAAAAKGMRQNMPGIVIPASRDIIQSLLCIICKIKKVMNILKLLSCYIAVGLYASRKLL